MVMPGKTLHVAQKTPGMNPTPGYHSHESPAQLEWYLFHEDQCVPVCIFEVKAIVDIQTAADDGAQRKGAHAPAKVPASVQMVLQAPDNDRNEDDRPIPRAFVAAAKVSIESIEKWNAKEAAVWLNSLEFANEIEPVNKSHPTGLQLMELMPDSPVFTTVPANTCIRLLAAITSKLPVSCLPSRSMEGLCKWLSTLELSKHLQPIMRKMEVSEWTLEQVLAFLPLSPEFGDLPPVVIWKLVSALHVFRMRSVPIA